jgi:pimeloyl-ACP methyl ester carboxylesterase
MEKGPSAYRRRAFFMAMTTVPGSVAVDVVRAESARFRHPLLLVHGLWSGGWIWSGFASYLAHRGWESWVLSCLRGSGHERARQLDEVAGSLPASPILIAHDAGVVTATQVAAHVGTPALVAIAPLVPGAEGGGTGAFSHRQFWAARLFARVVAPPRDAAAREWLRGLADEDVQRLQPDSAPFLRALLSGAERIPDDLTVPTLLVCGAGDPVTSADACERLATRRGWAFERHTMPGHFPMLAPGWERLADRVHRWLVTSLGEDLLLYRDEGDAPE